MEHLVAKASNPPRDYTHRRLNLRGLIILSVVLVVAVISFFPIKAFSDRSTRQSALAQAKASEKSGNIDLALRHMERYVAAWPTDLAGLEYQAKLLADTAQPQNLAQIMAAASVNDQVLRLDPNGADRQDTRRRLIRLYLQFGDGMRRRAVIRKETGEETSELRYRAAVVIARQLISNGANDAEAHRLLAASLEGISAGGDSKVVDEAITEYRKAMNLDPADTTAPAQLAKLLVDKKKDRAGAEQTMDAMLKAQPKSIPVRMARSAFFNWHPDNDKRSPAEVERDNQRALAELEAASELAPTDATVQAVAAANAIQRRDFDRARRHLDAIPKDQTNELKVRTLRGMLEYNERHPDEAIEEWRRGLVSVGGTDLELTWQLAHTLIQLGRVNDARPLISQFQRLGGQERDAMGRLLRALSEQQSGRHAAAIKELNRIADQVPASSQYEVYLALGRCHEALAEEGQALLAYQKAVVIATSLNSSAAEPRRGISRITANKNPAEAMTEMERALSQSPNDLALIIEVGRLRLKQQMILPESLRRWDGVSAMVDRALKIDPNNFAVETLQADTLAASGRLAEALTLLRKSVQGLGKNKVEIWLTYAGALDRLNRVEEALTALDQASAPDAVGDHASLRIARARFLARLNRGQAARDVLTVGRDKVPKSERPELAHALGNLCRELGLKDEARAALADWAKQLPDSAEPGLALISFAQAHNDDEAARLGLEALRALGGDQQPYGLAARALELLRVDQTRSNSTELYVPTDPTELKRLDEADRLVTQLNTDAPQLPVVPMIQGLILERRGKVDEAIDAYRRSVKDATASPALARLVELLSRRGRFDEIEQLKAKFESRASKDGTPAILTSFEQINAAVAVKLGDNEKALQAVTDMVKAQPNDLSTRINQARLFVRLGKNKEGEATLRQLAALRPGDAAPWLALISFRAQHMDLGDANKLVDEIRLGYKGPHPELLIARGRWISGDVAGATKLFDMAIAQNGDDLTTLRDAIEFDDANGRTKEAEVKLRRALKVDPKATWASRTLAMILTGRPDRSAWQEAWSLIKPGAPGSGEAPEDRLVRATVLARSPENAQRALAAPELAALANDLPASNPVAIDARVRLAQALLDYNQPAEAAKMIAPIAEDTDHPNPSALAISIEALVRAQDTPTAQKRLDRLKAIEPKSSRTAASTAWVLQGSGKPDEATAVVTAAYSEVEGTNGGEPVALAFQDLLVKLGLKDGAMKLAQRIATKWPRDAYVLARTQFAANNVAEAIKSCETALRAGDVRAATRVATSITIAKRDDLATLQAVDNLATMALAQSPKDPEVVSFVAMLRHLQGRFEEEVAMHRVVLANTPQTYKFLNNMAWTLCEGLQRYDEALERIDDAIRREGRIAEFLDTRGVILIRQGKLDDGIANLEESIKLYQLAGQPPSAVTYFHLARAYRELRKMDGYQRYRDLARKYKLDASSLDPPDKADYASVMGGA